MNSTHPKYLSLIIFLNRRCTVGCASCNARALPGNKAELSRQWLSSFFRKLDNLNFSGYILWTGGEPFLSFDALQWGISLASQQGYHSEILTSGHWFDAHPEWLDTLAGNRKLSIRLSLDAEHQEKVPLSRLIAFISRAWELQMEINFTLREIPGQQEPVNQYIEKIKTHLPQFYHLNYHRSRWIHYIPHIPVSPDGHLSSPGNVDSSGRQQYQQPCHMAFRDLVIGEDGLVYPCCGLFGFSFHRQLAVGNPMKESWESLAGKPFTHPLFRMLTEKGPYGICQVLNLEPEKWGWPWFQTPCHLCMALFHQKGKHLLQHLVHLS